MRKHKMVNVFWAAINWRTFNASGVRVVNSFQLGRVRCSYPARSFTRFGGLRSTRSRRWSYLASRIAIGRHITTRPISHYVKR